MNTNVTEAQAFERMILHDDIITHDTLWRPVTVCHGEIIVSVCPYTYNTQEQLNGFSLNLAGAFYYWRLFQNYVLISYNW